jgi:hypothetical protein
MLPRNVRDQDNKRADSHERCAEGGLNFKTGMPDFLIVRAEIFASLRGAAGCPRAMFAELADLAKKPATRALEIKNDKKRNCATVKL